MGHCWQGVTKWEQVQSHTSAHWQGRAAGAWLGQASWRPDHPLACRDLGLILCSKMEYFESLSFGEWRILLLPFKLWAGITNQNTEESTVKYLLCPQQIHIAWRQNTAGTWAQGHSLSDQVLSYPTPCFSWQACTNAYHNQKVQTMNSLTSIIKFSIPECCYSSITIFNL